MVTICTKKFCQPTVQDRILEKSRKKKEKEDIEEIFKYLKEKREQGGSRVLSGTSVPNSTFKSLHTDVGKRREKDNSEISIQDNTKAKSSSSVISKQSLASSLRNLKQNVKEKEESSAILIKADQKSRPSSILSGTSTLEELKELKDLLHKSSYVPKQTRTRRPTIEKIKSAIEKEKQNLIDKKESTINASIELSDASTSTERKKKKKVKNPKHVVNSSARSSSTFKSIGAGSNVTQTDKKRKKVTRKKKQNDKIDVEIQCSLFKVKISD